MKTRQGSRWQVVAAAAALALCANAPRHALPNPFDRKVAPLVVGDRMPPTAFVDQAGARVRLDELRGQTVAVAFIYTRCTDACPIITQKFARLERTIGPGRYDLIEVTIDPEHDTQAEIAAYARRFGVRSARWRIVTGEPSAVAGFVRAAGVSVIANSSGDIVHNARLLLIAPDGRLADVVELAAWDPATVAAQMQHLAGQASSPWARADFALTKTIAQLCGGSYEVASGILDIVAGVLVIGLGAVALLWLRHRIFTQGA